MRRRARQDMPRLRFTIVQWLHSSCVPPASRFLISPGTTTRRVALATPFSFPLPLTSSHRIIPRTSTDAFGSKRARSEESALIRAWWVEAEQRRRLATAVDATVLSVAGLSLCGPHAVALYLQCPLRYRYIHGLQCLFALRYSELVSVDLLRIRRGGPIPILTTKGGEPRVLDCRFVRSIPQWQAVSFAEVPGLAEYDGVSHDVAIGVIRSLTPVRERMKSNTHIWRHLRAEYMEAQGKEIDEIARYLGHKSLDSTREYLRPRVRPTVTA